jgi:oxygen-independent coproporphyrinogen-3 oxidase
LTPAERWQEAVITGLRLVRGISMADMTARYGVDLEARFGDDLRRFEEAGVLARCGDRVRLTRRGMLVANDVLRVFI